MFTKDFDSLYLKNLRHVSFYSLYRASLWSCEGNFKTIFLIWTIFDFLILLIFVLINVAFITLLERKILGYSQRRIGPNKPSFIGLLQPIADAVKLFIKNFLISNKILKLVFYFIPIISLFLVLWVWIILPLEFNISFFTFSSILLLIILRLNVYPLLLRGWASKNKYSIMGALRRVAQTISYEISLALILLIILIYYIRIRFDFFILNKTYFKIFLISPFIFSLWIISRLAETNRTPFDFSEGERELVSGFNVEYGAGGFAIIFMAEYGRILFLSILSRILFCLSANFFMISIITAILVFIWVWVRTTFPRYRYDLLINLAWKRFLPFVLSLIILIIRLNALYIKISCFFN